MSSLSLSTYFFINICLNWIHPFPKILIFFYCTCSDDDFALIDLLVAKYFLFCSVLYKAFPRLTFQSLFGLC